jgi:hypothetical protein
MQIPEIVNSNDRLRSPRLGRIDDRLRQTKDEIAKIVLLRRERGRIGGPQNNA